MKKIIELKELQAIELDMMQFIDRLCRKHKIKYFLAGGTLLGAVRHQGFIPWDDDIDIAMLRDDYEKFIKLMLQTADDTYQLLCCEHMPGYYYPFAKVVNKRTRLVEKQTKDLPEMGVFVDVFPIDGMGNEYHKAKRRLLSIVRLRSRIWEAGLQKGEIKNAETRPLQKAAKAIPNSLIRMIGIQRSYLWMKKYVLNQPVKDSRWIASAVGGANIERELIEKSAFAECIEIKFADCSFWAPVGYDKYLGNLYGNYMELPPEHQRVACHTAEIWWKEGKRND